MRIPIDTITSVGDVQAARPAGRPPNMTFASLDEIQVASPCAVDWDRMAGDDVVRFCPQCRQNVYNLSGMTADQATALLRESEKTPCVRFYRRRDGTVMTADCPVGVRRLVYSTWRLAAIGLSAAFALVMGLVSWGLRQQAGGGSCSGVTVGVPARSVPAAAAKAQNGPPDEAPARP